MTSWKIIYNSLCTTLHDCLRPNTGHVTHLHSHTCNHGHTRSAGLRLGGLKEESLLNGDLKVQL